MTRSAMSRGPVGYPATKGHLRADGGRLVVVHAASHLPERIVDQLSRSWLEVIPVALGRSVLDELLTLAPEVVLIDHESDDFDVVRVCRDLSETLLARIVVVSGAGTIADEELQVAALEAGADDFLPTSTSERLLIARIRAALRIRSATGLRRAQLILGDVVIDLDAHALYIAGAPVKCPPLQFLLLLALAREPNRMIDRDSLLRRVWGAQPGAVDPQRLRTAVSLLRSLLGRSATRPRVETVSHLGYRLVVDVTAEIGA